MARSSKKTKEIDKDLGLRIKHYRLIHGLSREHVAKHLGVTHQQIQKYECSINRVPACRLLMLSKILDVSVLGLLNEDDVDPPSEDQRILMEIGKNVGKIQRRQKVAILNLTRALSDD